MQNCKIISVVGARPNFMKIAPFIKAIKEYNASHAGSLREVEHILVHTGQHYDLRMSESFFKELDIPEPDLNLEVGSGSHAEQVGATMIEFERVLQVHKPDWVVLVGDVNATLACSITAKKECIKVCHIEAGLRSGDLTMPEEINRLVTDRISDLLLTPDHISSDNLRSEGTPEHKIRLVGNIMIDALEANRNKAKSLDLGQILKPNRIDGPDLKIKIPREKAYIALTLHRPSNVDKKEILEPLVDLFLEEVSNEFTLIWPVHPRTQRQLKDFGLWGKVSINNNIILLEPVGYHEMLRITMGARVMFTDSGGLQEECCVLGIPCITLRWNTERPVTLVEHGGVCILAGNDVENIRKAYNLTLKLDPNPSRPALWDGHTAEKCLEEILNASANVC